MCANLPILAATPPIFEPISERAGLFSQTSNRSYALQPLEAEEPGEAEAAGPHDPLRGDAPASQSQYGPLPRGAGRRMVAEVGRVPDPVHGQPEQKQRSKPEKGQQSGAMVPYPPRGPDTRIEIEGNLFLKTQQE